MRLLLLLRNIRTRLPHSVHSPILLEVQVLDGHKSLGTPCLLYLQAAIRHQEEILRLRSKQATSVVPVYVHIHIYVDLQKLLHAGVSK